MVASFVGGAGELEYEAAANAKASGKYFGEQPCRSFKGLCRYYWHLSFIAVGKRYCLYAAVSCKCLLVTNDEMRDHFFQLLGTSFFPRWKEKHQVTISVSREEGLKLHMPPPYSIIIQYKTVEQLCKVTFARDSANT
ncbi:hypothetical protein Bca52824_095767 [Brassica carinata]|uniref:PRORP domain-containing protein n=1 Tax=Brassica carinata TaxID=52824 RepID=A0A8X7THN7_BRACI|nr:hypothetical protein Bca52824_095767 [Brassica carinata]